MYKESVRLCALSCDFLYVVCLSINIWVCLYRGVFSEEVKDK